MTTVEDRFGEDWSNVLMIPTPNSNYGSTGRTVTIYKYFCETEGEFYDDIRDMDIDEFEYLLDRHNFWISGFGSTHNPNGLKTYGIVDDTEEELESFDTNERFDKRMDELKNWLRHKPSTISEGDIICEYLKAIGYIKYLKEKIE